MQLQSYLDRIGYAGPVRADFKTLAQIHKHHLMNIPYENIDVQFGRTVSLNIEPIFDKIMIEHHLRFADPFKTVNVKDIRTMAVLVVQKDLVA